MTGYESKKKAASAKTIDEVNWVDHELDGLAQPAQEPLCYASINKQGDVCSTLKQRDSWRTVPLYTTPPQRTWVEPSFTEWFEWWRVSAIADSTEAEIDFSDFFIIAQAVIDKLKETNK